MGPTKWKLAMDNGFSREKNYYTVDISTNSVGSGLGRVLASGQILDALLASLDFFQSV